MKKDASQMRQVLREFCTKAGSQAAAAIELEVSRSYVSDMLNGRRDISENVAQRLGYKRTLVYEALK